MKNGALERAETSSPSTLRKDRCCNYFYKLCVAPARAIVKAVYKRAESKMQLLPFSASFVGLIVTIHDDMPKSFSEFYSPSVRIPLHNFAQALLSFLNIISSVLGSSCKLLTGFTRRLLLQLLLEPEKIYVYVISASGQCGLPVSAGALSCMTIAEPRHPAYNHGKKHKLLYVSAESSCAELTRLLTGISVLFND